MKKPWTEAEDALLRSLMGRPCIEIAEAMGRSQASINSRIYQLRYCEDAIQADDTRDPKILRLCAIGRKIDELVKSCAEQHGIAGAAEKLGLEYKTVKAVAA